MNGSESPQALQRRGRQPLWQQIELALLQDIRSGTLREGMQLPSARDLALRFGVNRQTVRHAIESLQERGVLRTENGCGSFVQEHPYRYLIGRRARFGRAMHDLNVSSEYRLLDAGVQAASRVVQRALRLVPGQQVQRIVYASSVEGRQVDYSEAWFPHERFPGICAVFERERSITRSLASFGVHDYLRQYTAVMARLPNAEVALALGQSTRRPVLHVQSINVDPHGVPVQFGDTWFAGDWIQLLLAPDA